MVVFASAAGPIVAVIYLAIIVFTVVIAWKLFTKADQPGWACLIPIYNVIVFLRVIGRPWWWLFLFFVPLINYAVATICYLDLAKSYGKSMWFGIWMWVPLVSTVLLAIISLGSAVYRGPAGHEPWDMDERGHGAGPALAEGV